MDDVAVAGIGEATVGESCSGGKPSGPSGWEILLYVRLEAP